MPESQHLENWYWQRTALKTLLKIKHFRDSNLLPFDPKQHSENIVINQTKTLKSKQRAQGI